MCNKCKVQGSRLRLKRSHLRPKIFICEWCFCWGRQWRLYKLTCYDLKICMQLFCDHIFCYVPVLNLKLKDDAHQSFSGKKSFKQSSSLPHSNADAHSLLNAAQLCSARDRNDGDVQVKVQKSSVYFVHNFNKLQQLKLSAVWILAILLRILIYNHY